MATDEIGRFQVHHIIPQSVFKRYGAILEEYGFLKDTNENFIMLFESDEDARKIRELRARSVNPLGDRPMGSTAHLNDHRGYTKAVSNHISNILERTKTLTEPKQSEIRKLMFADLQVKLREMLMAGEPPLKGVDDPKPFKEYLSKRQILTPDDFTEQGDPKPQRKAAYEEAKKSLTKSNLVLADKTSAQKEVAVKTFVKQQGSAMREAALQLDDAVPFLSEESRNYIRNDAERWVVEINENGKLVKSERGGIYKLIYDIDKFDADEINDERNLKALLGRNDVDDITKEAAAKHKDYIAKWREARQELFSSSGNSQKAKGLLDALKQMQADDDAYKLILQLERAKTRGGSIIFKIDNHGKEGKPLKGSVLWEKALKKLYEYRGKEVKINGMSLNALTARGVSPEIFKSSFYIDTVARSELARGQSGVIDPKKIQDSDFKMLADEKSLSEDGERIRNIKRKIQLAEEAAREAGNLEKGWLLKTKRIPIKVLKGLGLFSLLIWGTQVAQAKSIGDDEQVDELFSDFALSSIGSAAATSITVGLLSLALGLTTGPIALAAGLIAGFFGGSERVVRFIYRNTLSDKKYRRMILSKLSSTMFGQNKNAHSFDFYYTKGQGRRVKFIGIDIDENSVAALAKDENNPDVYAYRYALLHMNPFVVLDTNYQEVMNAPNRDSTAPFPGNFQDLQSYDQTHGVGMSEEFIDRRAKMMEAYLRHEIYEEKADHEYVDLSVEAELAHRKTFPTKDKVSGKTVFANMELLGTNLTGTEGKDYLFGGSGDDVLTAVGDGDYLEGGTGSNTYKINNGSHNVIIRDNHLLSKILINDKPFEITGKEKDLYKVQGDNVWITPDYQLQWLDNKDLYVKSRSSNSDVSFIIKNWKHTVLGINPNDYGRQFQETSYQYEGNYRGQIIGKEIALHTKPGDRDYNTYYWAVTERLTDGTLLHGVEEEGFADVIRSDDHNSRMNGRSGDDALGGGKGNDEIYGGDGNDLLAGKSGEDRIYGGEGNDFISSNSPLTAPNRYSPNDKWTAPKNAINVIYAGSTWGIYTEKDGKETNEEPEIIWDGVGNIDANTEQSEGDFIYGGFGNDHIIGSWANDIIWGDEELETIRDGEDIIFGLSGNDIIHGSGGSDKIYGDGIFKNGYLNTVPGEYHGDDTIYGGKGNDTIIGGGGNDVIYGGVDKLINKDDEDDDTIYGDDPKFVSQFHGIDKVFGGAGNDKIIGGGKNDELYGGSGNDTIWGDGSENLNNRDITVSGDDHIYGEDGNDTIYGGFGNDIIQGGEGNDILQGQDDNDLIFGNTGDDSLYGDNLDEHGNPIGNQGIDTLNGGDGNDLLIGGGNSDTLIGGHGNDKLWGDDGNTPDKHNPTLDGEDYLDAGQGDDYLDGGYGNDTLLGGDGKDLLFGGIGADYLYGNDGNDSIYGDTGYDSIDESGANYDNNDYIDGGAGDDNLIGSIGDDHIIGGLGDDKIWGDDSSPSEQHNEKICGNDTLEGGEGNDFLDGGYGDDELYGGDGDDNMIGGYGKDTIYGGSGNDISSGGAEDDLLYGEEGNDALHGDDGDDIIEGGEGRDILFGDEGNDQLSGGSDNDQLSGGNGDDNLSGDENDDTLLGNDGNDTLTGGTGNDYLQGGQGKDLYVFADDWGHDVVVEEDKDNRLYFSTMNSNQLGFKIINNDLLIYDRGKKNTVTVKNQFYKKDANNSFVSDITFSDGKTIYYNEIRRRALASIEPSNIFEDKSNNAIYGDEQDNNIAGDDTDNIISGGKGNDHLYGGRGNDKLYGDDGNDRIDGGLGDDTLYGGEGDDYLDGDEGNDTVYGGEGDDHIEETRGRGTGDDVFDGGTGNDVLISYSGNDMLIGGEGDDSLTGGYYIDTERTIFNGGPGNDHLVSGRGSNTFIFGKNFGQDNISDYLIPSYDPKAPDTVNTIRFEDDWKLSDFIFRRDDYSLIISARKSDDKVTIFGQFIDGHLNSNGKHAQYHIDRIIFSDGTELDQTAIAKLIQQGTEENDNLYAGDDGKTLFGMEGDDVLHGTAGVDVLDGGVGKDTLIGYDGDDILDGGENDDVLRGGDGADTYVFKGSWGKDTIYDNQSENRIRLEDCSLEDIRFSRINGRDLLMRKLGTENEILIKAQFSDEGVLDARSITQWEFADGRVLSSTEVNKLLHQGTDGDDVMEGDAYDNILAGQAGNDFLHGNDGNDEIDGGDGDDHLHGDGGDDQLDGGNGNDTLDGGRGNDRLNGGDGNDTLDGGDGADILAGGKGDDSYIIGDNDTVILGESMGSDHLHIAKGKYAPLKNVTIQLDIPITPEQVQVIRKDFNDAVTGVDDYSLFNPEMPLSTPKGTLKDTFSEIRYMLSAHLPSLEKGRDYLIGSLGDAQDWELPKDRAFVLNVDRGIPFDNAFSQWTRQDQYYLKFDTVSKHYFTITPKPGISNDLLLNFGSAGQLTIDKGLSGNLYGDITLSFKNGSKMSISELLQRQLDAAQTDGNDVIRGFASNDYLRGGAGNDILQGGEGDDSLEGGVGDDILSGGYYSLYWNTPESIYKGHYQYQDSRHAGNPFGSGRYSSTPSPGLGNDTYIFFGAFGHDTVIDCDETKGNIDTLWFKDIASLEELNFRKVENNLVIATKDNRSSVTVINQFSKEQPHWGVESIQLGNGQAMKLDDVFLAPLMTQGTEHDDVLVNTSNQDIKIDGYAGNDTITSGAGNDTINGGDGNDTIDAGGGDDIIDGGNGDDRIDGGGGNDIITGGSGNDNMTGGDGYDEFIFSKGWGQDYIWSTWTRDLSNDVIRFTDVTPDEITMREQDGDMLLTRKGSNDSIRVSSQFSEGSPISKIIFADGSEWDRKELSTMLIVTTNGADIIETSIPNITIHGGSGNDIIRAKNGINNRLYGDAGDDSLRGDGELYGGDGNDTLKGMGKLYGGSGNDNLMILWSTMVDAANPLYGDGGDGDDTLSVFGSTGFGHYGDGVGAVAPPRGESVITLHGGKGNDTIYGSFENEIYEFSLGDGHDTIIEREAMKSTIYLRASWDVLRFGSGIKAEDIHYLRQGKDLLIRHKNGTDSITVQNFFYIDDPAYHHYRINEVQFADGTTHTDSDIDRFVTQGSHQGNNKNSKMAANVADFSGGQHSRPMANNVAPAGVSADVIDQTALHHAQNLVQAMSTFDQRGINTNSLNGPDDSNLVNKMPLAPSL